MDLVLHVVDRIRTEPRARGLDSEPRQASGTIEVPASARALAEHDPDARAFLERHLGARFTPVDIYATTREVTLSQPGWTFTRETEPPGGSCVVEPGFDQVSVTPRGAGLDIHVRPRTESPARVDLLRVATRARVLRGRVVARLVGAGGSLGSEPRRDGVYVVRLRALTPGGRLATELLPFVRRNGRFRRMKPFIAPEDCILLRSFSASRPVFGGRPRRPLRVTIRTVEPARATVVVTRRGRRVRRLRLGQVGPGRARRLRLPAGRLRRGRYTLRLTVATGDGRIERARIAARRL